MKKLIFTLIYTALGAGLLAAYYFNNMPVFGILSIIYFIVLTADYTNEG